MEKKMKKNVLYMYVYPGNRTEIIELEQRSHSSQESHVNTSFSI